MPQDHFRAGPVPAASAQLSTDAPDSQPTRRPSALIVDWGGVLTSPLADTLDGWYAAEGISADVFQRALRGFQDPGLAALGAFDPVAALERGELAVASFQEQLAEQIRRVSGVPVRPEGLIGRMFAGFEQAPAMINVVRRAKRAGLKTALLSNSWGNDYLREDWDALFDATVISGEVGMRKPEPAIFAHTLELLDCPPQRAVFVDDLKANVRGAAACGLIAVHHRSYEETVAELEVLFGIDLRGE